jgi:hypothetical protein
LDALPPNRKTGNVIALWFRAEQPVDTDPWVRIEVRGPAGSSGRDVDLHLPGGWLLPAARWPPGRLVLDETLVRITSHQAPDPVTFVVALEEGNRIVEPISADVPVHDGFVTLATVPWRDGAPGIFQALHTRGGW